MIDPISWLFDASAYMDRWHCIRDDPALGYTLLWSNGVTSAAYLSLGFPLIRIYRAHRHSVASSFLLAGFATFIALCGVHHAFYDVAFRHPSYRAFAFADVLMGVASTVVAAATWTLADSIARLRPISEVEAERDAKVAALAAMAAEKDRFDSLYRSAHEMYLANLNVLSDTQVRLDVFEAKWGRAQTQAEVRATIRAMSDELRGIAAAGGFTLAEDESRG